MFKLALIHLLTILLHKYYSISQMLPQLDIILGWCKWVPPTFLSACVMGGGIGFESQFSYGWRNISNTMCINKLMDCTYCKPYKNTRYMFSLEVYKLFMTTHEQIRSNVLLLTEMVTAMHTYLVHNVSTGPVYPTLWYTTHILCLCASICPYLPVNHC